MKIIGRRNLPCCNSTVRVNELSDGKLRRCVCGAKYVVRLLPAPVADAITGSDDIRRVEFERVAE